ncbi:hypothetical protein K1T71_004893 [Dendrolimus kikuchii]|uniref:Uncharacterized protein n=1 Tax=Dendrolimus kikuchii TaxID=765133 RepID=A0ACC1D5U2_9NEOP|nr:hypothetical protein K1T71_004893 [Dendrolimus kikuchii]
MSKKQVRCVRMGLNGALLFVPTPRGNWREVMYVYSYSVPVPTAVETHNLFIPTTIKACTNSQCQAICEALGYHHGNCVSPSTCHCY